MQNPSAHASSNRQRKTRHRHLPLLALAAIATASAVWLAGPEPIEKAWAISEKGVHVPAAQYQAKEGRQLQVAILAGGCFWGVEGVFSHVKGVKNVVSGYHGGSASDARYTLVSAGRTRHAEAVRITYDPAQIRYDQLLQIYFSVVVDPTLLNRQGPDKGAQYRSAIIPRNAEQKKVAQKYIAQLERAGIWKSAIVTKIESYSGFYKAESYHQDYMFNNPYSGYIVRWDKPKVANLKKFFPAIYRKTPVKG